MGIIQSAVNQTLGTVSTVAGIGRVIKTGQENVDLQKKAAEEATAEREKKKNYAAQIAEEIEKDESLQPTTVLNQVSADEFEPESTIEPSARGIYLQNQLANVYEESGEFAKAFDLRQKAQGNQQILDLMKNQQLRKKDRANAEAQAKKDLKADQDRQKKEFEKQFLEGVAEIKGINAIDGISEKKYAGTMKGVRSVTTFGADTGDPTLRSRTVYTPRGEETK